MSVDSFTLDQVAQLLNTVVAGIRTGDQGDDLVYSLPEVHERTGFALSTLEDDCKSGTIEHTRRGRTIGLTSRQIAILVTRHRSGGDLAHRGTSSTDPFRAVREATLKSGAKRGRNYAA